MTRYAVGVDIGGTFTDFAIHDTQSGMITGLKCPTTPADPVQGLIDGLAILAAERGIHPADIGTFVHGTTIAVNTLIQRNGARLGLLVTEGFRDLLEIQRLALHTGHSWKGARPTPLIPRQHVFEVRERLRANGTVHHPLDETALPGIAAASVAERLDGLVICFLHAYRNPVHEHAVRDRLAALAPGLFIGCSADIWPQMREYERAMISIINGYVTPKVDSYLSSLERRLAEVGLAAVPYITRSNGGLMTARSARNRPAETLLSGPAAGVTGAVRMASELGIADFVTLDIGGTSADVAFVEGGRAAVSQSEHIAEFPIMMPVIGVSSIGAGGGSMIWLDGAGVLRIGPDSVGSDPGPACYGRGGTTPALTDAFLAGGYLNPAGFAGGRITLRRDLAEAALDGIAAGLAVSRDAAIEGILKVTVASLFAELSNLAAQRGVDVREYALVPFGGAGALLACLVADELGMVKVAVPQSPGTLCALGALSADVAGGFVRSLLVPIVGSGPALREVYAALEAQARGWLAEEQTATTDHSIALSADMRYAGQSFEIDVPLLPAWIVAGDEARVAAAFHEAHRRVYGHADPSMPAEIVDLRLTVIGTRPKPPLQAAPQPIAAANPTARRVCFGGTAIDVPAWPRSQVPQHLAGPALIDQPDTTVFLPPGWVGTSHATGTLILERTA